MVFNIKKINMLLLCILSIILNINCGDKSTETVNSDGCVYFPLAKGNEWTYKYIYIYSSGSSWFLDSIKGVINWKIKSIEGNKISFTQILNGIKIKYRYNYGWIIDSLEVNSIDEFILTLDKNDVLTIDTIPKYNKEQPFFSFDNILIKYKYPCTSGDSVKCDFITPEVAGYFYMNHELIQQKNIGIIYSYCFIGPGNSRTREIIELISYRFY